MGETDQLAFERNIGNLVPMYPPSEEVFTFGEQVQLVRALGCLTHREALVIAWLADGDDIQAIASSLRRPVWYTHRVAERAFQKVLQQLE